jgi:hypothetical protein
LFIFCCNIVKVLYIEKLIKRGLKMPGKGSPVIKIDDFKDRLAAYVDREHPGVIKQEELFSLVEESLSLLRHAGADFLDKFLVIWRGYDVLCYLQIRIACKSGGLSGLLEISQKMSGAVSEIFGQELADAANECLKNGEYNSWYFGTRYNMWRNGTWPIAG